MIEIKLGDRYAKSILQLAEERKEVERIHQDFELIEATCESNPDFLNMLRSPLISSAKKQTILDLVFKGNLAEMTKQLIEIIVRKKRERYLYDIAVRFGELYDRTHNITRGILTSAAPLSEEQRKTIKEMVEKQLQTTFKMEEKIDPELIGGFTLKVGDLLFDGSTSARLRDLKKEFLSNPYVKKV